MQRIKLTQQNTAEVIAQAVQVLRAGGLVIYPTETMYGIGADALNPEAVTKMLRFKNRPAGKAVSVLVANQEAAEQIVELNDEARRLYRTFLPGPVTVISQSRNAVDPRLQSELGTLGIRISSHPLAQGLAEAFGRPITSTSANASGAARPYTIETALSGLSEHQKNLVDLILDAGELPHNEPSTVIDTTQQTQVLRAGAGLANLVPSYHTESAEETMQLAETLMKSFLHALSEKPVLFALEGEMGTGKTQFAKGVAKALQITQPVTSPTYTLMNEYDGVSAGKPVRLIHIDCWRLDAVNPDELELDEYVQPGTVLVVEWAAPLLPYFKKKAERLVGHHLLFFPTSESGRDIGLEAL